MSRESSLRPASPVLFWVVCGVFLLAVGALLSGGCGNQSTAPAKTAGGTAARGADDHGKEDGHHHHAHGEKGPHGGALVGLGDHAAHLEVVLDPETGKVTVYVLDGEAENPISIAANPLEMTFTIEHVHDDEDADGKNDDADLPESGTLVLTPVAPDNGMAAVFEGTSDDLKGAEDFEAVLSAITIGSKTYPPAEFEYPEGNEHQHDH